MVKAVMISSSGRKTDLFSEHALLRDVFEQFHEDCAGTVNGELLQQEDLDKPLLLFGKESEMWIVSTSKAVEPSEEAPVYGAVQYGCREYKALTALRKAKEALDEAIQAIEALGTPLDDEEPPF